MKTTMRNKVPKLIFPIDRDSDSNEEKKVSNKKESSN